MIYVLLADIAYDINGGEYSHYTDGVLLGIEDIDSLESANKRAIELLNESAKDNHSILLCDSEINVLSLEEYMKRNNV